MSSDAIYHQTLQLSVAGQNNYAEILEKIHQELAHAMNKKKSTHVNQKDMSDGSTELF